MKKRFSPILFIAAVLVSVSAHAENYVGMAKPWQLGFQDPVTPVMERLNSMHDILLILCVAISAFVLVMLTYVCVRFSRKNNPIPSKTTHNVKLEAIWTIIPILILIAIAIPSLRLHYFMEDNSDADMTLKVVGNQWYWHYNYPDHGGFGFDSYMKKDEDLKEGEPRLLAVDNVVVVPVDTKVKVLLTAADVIHSWAVPSFGVKRDAVPGRLNEVWFEATKIGRFYGQCSELCGVGHGFMPIVIDVVRKEDFAAWVAAQQKEAGIVIEDVAEGKESETSKTEETDATKPPVDEVKEIIKEETL